MRVATFLIIALELAQFGCADGRRPPAKFAKQLSSADYGHVLATNRYFKVGRSVTRTEADTLSSAIKSAVKNTIGPPGWTDSPRRWDVEFPLQNNQVLVVSICYDVLRLGGVEYRDGSGGVRSVFQKWEDEREAGP